MERVLGVDFGERRVGVAVSDPTNTLATPLEPIVRRRGKRPPVSRLAEIAREHEVGQIVFGLPIGLDGAENDWCAEVRSVGDAVGERTGLPVAYVDERMTSVRAERAVRSVGLRRGERERKERIDTASAQLILQAWLDNPAVAR